jgi:hypothetical protein
MKRTGRYFEPGGPIDTPTVPGMPTEESVLGWYQNPEPHEGCMLVFTNEAIYSVDGRNVMRLQFADIIEYEFPTSKTDVTGVRVRTPDGFRFLRAAGSFGPVGNQKDAFSLIMVLRVLARRNFLGEISSKR